MLLRYERAMEPCILETIGTAIVSAFEVIRIPRGSLTCYLSDAHGIYLPYAFITSVTRENLYGVSDEDIANLLLGPEGEFYDDVWCDVLDHARIRLPDWTEYTLYQDGDLWLVPVGMVWCDTDGYVWPDKNHECRSSGCDGTLEACEDDHEQD